MKDLISIIIPIYNVPSEFLKKNIESCINQDYENIEIILVDDGSTDESGTICDEYSNKDNRIKVIHQKNKGLSGARNSGCYASTGKWILFVDGDDYLENDCCSTLIKSVTDDVDVLCFNSYRDNLKEKKVIYSKLEDNKIYQNEKEKLQYLTLDFNAHISTSWGKLIRKRIIDDNKLYHNETLRQGAEGIEFCMRLFEVSSRVKFIKKPLYNYVFNEKSISTMPTEENNYYILKCFKVIKENINNDMLLKMFYERMSYVIVTTIISGFFNYKNKEKYMVKKEKLKKYLNEDIVKTTLKRISFQLDIKRIIILYLAKLRCFFILYLIAKIYRK